MDFKRLPFANIFISLPHAEVDRVQGRGYEALVNYNRHVLISFQISFAGVCSSFCLFIWKG